MARTIVNYGGNKVECLSAFEVLNNNNRIKWFWEKSAAIDWMNENNADFVRFIPDVDAWNRDEKGNIKQYANVWD